GLQPVHRGFGTIHGTAHIVDVTAYPWVDCQGMLWQLSCQVGASLVQSSIGPVTGQGGHELGFGILEVVGHDVNGVVVAPTGRAHIDTTSRQGGLQQHSSPVDGGALVAIVSNGVAQVDVIPHVVRGDVVVALVFASQNQSTVGVDLDDAEAFSVGHAQVWIVGSGHHGVAGEDVQSIASRGRVVIGFEVAGGDALGLDVRVEGCCLVIGGHGDRDAASSFDI